MIFLLQLQIDFEPTLFGIVELASCNFRLASLL